MGWYMRLKSAVCNATIPALSLLEMTECACSPFCYVLHYLLFIKFISACYYVCGDWTVAIAQYSNFVC